MTDKYVDRGPVDPNDLPTMQRVEDILDANRNAHAPGSWQREAYEAAIGAVLSVHPDANVRFRGWHKQREHEQNMKAIEAAAAQERGE